MGLGVSGVMGLIKCSQGTIPVPLLVLPRKVVFSNYLSVANVSDSIPFLNILPFLLCKSLANPMVAAATVAAFGVLTPMPCIPIVTGKWSAASSKVKVCGSPAFDKNGKVSCMWNGNITVIMPGQFNTIIKI